MCGALIGGMDRLKREYIDTAKRHGVRLKVFTGKENKIHGKLGQPNFLIMFTNKVSHEARRSVMSHARAQKIPVYMMHSCGVSSLDSCLKEQV